MTHFVRTGTGSPRRFMRLAVFAAAMVLVPSLAPFDQQLRFGALALADDNGGGNDGGGNDGGDNDGGDNDGDDNDGDNGASGGGRSAGDGGEGRTIRRLFRRAPQRNAAVQPAQLPDRAPDEVLASGLDDDEIADLVGRGYTVLDRQTVQSQGVNIVRFRIRGGVSLEAARDEVTAVGINVDADFNHYYRPTASTKTASGGERQDCIGPACNARTLIGWPDLSVGETRCGAGVRIGLVDTGINPDHAAFDHGRLQLVDSPIEGQRQSGRRHGTAVASILIGSQSSRAPGLLPDATVIAVDAFYRAAGNDERSDAFTLVRAVELVRRQNVDIVNMSLSGPANTILENMMTALDSEGVIVVAAAGNRGPRAKPVYPAAYPNVIAVTAVDRNRRVYRRAGQGQHIDIAGPGVEVWIAASVRGARFATGTSYAVPFTTAAVALVIDELEVRNYDTVMAALAERAIDIGAPGRDDVFGHGLLQATGLCR